MATAAANVPAHRADARKVKAFIRSLGRIGKTDAIDARALARYGQERDAATDQITAIEADLRDLIGRDPATAEVVAIIEDIPGCGHVTAVTVAALMPELGAMTGRQAASLAGLAPHPHQSGQREGYRRTRGGRPEVKRALFMAAMAARNHNPTVYQRLLHNGKKPLVAITALMRKLITIINARVRDARHQAVLKLS